MPATRSQTKQIHIDNQAHLKAATSTKRKASEPLDVVERKTKKPDTKKGENGVKPVDGEEDAIVSINRAPVLELWAACVTSFLHCDLPWDICLSAGGAVSTICAISKGRAIGSIEKRSSEEVDRRRDARKIALATDLDELEVMGFTLAVKDGHVLVSDEPKRVNESALQHKFSGSYDKTKEAIESALATWKGSEEDLNAQAFHMYEDFRPNVPSGQKGWGRKGQLNLSTIRSAVQKPT